MENYLLVEDENIFQNVKNTFQSLTRIKILCFDVSENFIAFGASSGGIYIFDKCPCQFRKLIPTKEGSVDVIAISPNEKSIAAGTSKGLVITFGNCFTENNLKPEIHSDHNGYSITYLKWHNNDLYCGDDKGNVSLTVSPSLLTKAIFQTPMSIILHLDSSIVQIDSYLNYLLISTKTRTYLCNTENETFKQIGTKLRNGNFGACFLDTQESSYEVFEATDKVGELEKDPKSGVKIFCARPGVRLWQANFDASVVCTHQFRKAINNKIESEIIILSPNIESELNNYTPNRSNLPEGICFSKIFSFKNKYILTSTQQGFFMIDIFCGDSSFWSYHYENINDIKVVGSTLYIWRGNQINAVTLLSLEDIILKTLFSKQYLICSQLCLKYSEEIIKSLKHSKRLHLVTVLKEKLIGVEKAELLHKITPLLEDIECLIRGEIDRRIQENKTSVTENVSNKTDILESVSDFSHTDKEAPIFRGEKIQEGNNSKSSNENISESKFSSSQHSSISEDIMDDSCKIKILHEQYKINKIHKNVMTTKMDQLFQSIGLEEFKDLLNKLILHIEESEEENAEFWCQELFLNFILKKNLHEEKSEFNVDIRSYILQCFEVINDSNNSGCHCSFPLPKSKNTKPKFFEVVRNLISQPDELLKVAQKTPYMWRHYFDFIADENIFENLPLLIQYHDMDILRRFSSLLKFDYWDEIIRLYIKLRKKKCLNCDESIDINGVTDWTNFALTILQCLGGPNTLKLLSNYADMIPKGELDSEFYQACIFTTSVGGTEDRNLSKSLALIKKSQESEDFKSEIVSAMSKFLNDKYSNDSVKTMFMKPAINCSYCDIPIDSPVLSEYKSLICGHIYHSVCLKFTEGNCLICIQ